MQLIGRRYDTGRLVRLAIERGRIARVQPITVAENDLGHPPWIAPGLIDLQVNGYGGQEFCSADLTVEKVTRIASQMAPFGVTRFCPTLTTQALPVMDHALRTVARACESPGGTSRRIAGIHLEGPYLTTEDGPRGAHPKEHCRRPNWDEFQRMQEAAGGRIRLLTMSVEFDESPEFVAKVSQSGVIVAIGHTSANADQIRAATDAGARMSTHLGNGAHPMLPRHRNYLFDQLAEDRLAASLIADGHHLPPAVLKTFVRAKQPERCILVSDMAGQAGLPPGRYRGNLCDVEVLSDGRLVMAGQTELMAGATAPIGVGVANMVRFAGVDLNEAIRMAVHHPAELLGLEPGNLLEEDPADLVLFRLDDDFDVQATVIGGQLTFGSIESNR